MDLTRKMWRITFTSGLELNLALNPKELKNLIQQYKVAGYKKVRVLDPLEQLFE